MTPVLSLQNTGAVNIFIILLAKKKDFSSSSSAETCCLWEQDRCGSLKAGAGGKRVMGAACADMKTRFYPQGQRYRKTYKSNSTGIECPIYKANKNAEGTEIAQRPTTNHT